MKLEPDASKKSAKSSSAAPLALVLCQITTNVSVVLLDPAKGILRDDLHDGVRLSPSHFIPLSVMLIHLAMEIKLKEGDPAPDFRAPVSGGGEVSLSDFAGKHVVLYFYPRDSTPGCTKEACGFRDFYSKLSAKGAVVLGVSTDTLASHEKFASKFKLPFPLVSDEDKKIAQAYGAWGQKSFLGRKYMGIHRITFLIGPDGRIKKIWPKVKPDEHAAEVLAAIE